MTTKNYNLPMINGNMNADIVRDMNALAEATDGAIKEAVDSVDNRVTQHLEESGRKEYLLFSGALTSGTAALTLPPGLALLDFSEVVVKLGSTFNYGSVVLITKVGEFLSHSYNVMSGDVPTLYWINFVVRSSGVEIILNREGKANGTAFIGASTSTWIAGIWGVKYV